jgi:hypothetical protein
VLELIDGCILPSDEDDVTFSIQTSASEMFKLRGESDRLQVDNGLIRCSLGSVLAIDAKERQKWIDKLRSCSGLNAASAVRRRALLDGKTIAR